MSDYLDRAETQAEFAAQRAEHARRLAAQEAEKARLQAELAALASTEQKNRQRLAAEKIDANLRASFFAANPSASEEDWLRLGPRIKDEYMITQASQASPTVFERIRAEAQTRQAGEDSTRERFEQFAKGNQ